MDGKPKVLILHNEYLQPGGEDLVLANERQLLEAHDHKVEVRTRSNTEIGGAFSKLKVAWQLPYSDEGRH